MLCCGLLSLEASATEVIQPVLGTQSMLGSGDRADDPAIWVNQRDTSKSIVFGVNKSRDGVNGGVYSFKLDGKATTQQAWEEGVNLFEKGERYNNIDLRYGFKAGSERWDIVCASNRSDREIDVFRVITNSQGNFVRLEHVGEVPIGSGFIQEEEDAPYGLGMYHAKDLDKHFVLISDKEGRVGQYELSFNPQGSGDNQVIGSRVAGPLDVSRDESEVEGIVADDDRGVIYIAAEDNGIYRYPTNQNGVIVNNRVVVANEADKDYLQADLEGLALYQGADGSGYLIASVQEINEYAVFDREYSGNGANRYLKSVRIAGVEKTDGLDVSSTNFGGAFSKGLIVVHDGVNPNITNYKFAKWEDLADAGNPKLDSNPDQPASGTINVRFNNNQLSNYSGQHKSGTVFVSNSNRNIRIQGNSWKKFELNYEVTANTVLEFEYKTDNQGEIIGIGLDSNNNHKDRITSFQLTGNQNWTNAYSDYKTPSSRSFQQVQIPVGSFFTGSIQYLTLIADDDNNALANVVFKNVTVREKN